jgi:hypothetical protein
LVPWEFCLRCFFSASWTIAQSVFMSL